MLRLLSSKAQRRKDFTNVLDFSHFKICFATICIGQMSHQQHKGQRMITVPLVLYRWSTVMLMVFRRPDDWTLSWGGSGQIWGWGHNHRGQLGGVEGAKVKLPVSCEPLAGLRPVQLIGGEQTLFAVTGDGKVSHFSVSALTLAWFSG